METQTPETANEKKDAEPLEPRFMYIGPNVTGLGLLHGNVYIGGKPPHCADAFKECRAIEELFVELDMEPGKSRAAAPLLAVEHKTGTQGRLAEAVSKWVALKTAAKAQRN
jgi:hypothetical protein